MSTEATTCCASPDPVWTARKDGERYVDALVCNGCHHEHKAEPWLVPLIPPDLLRGKCVNCAGTLHIANRREIIRMETADRLIDPVWSCRECDLTEKDAYVLHRKLARLHPSNEFLEAAVAAAEAGRYVLALKLATADLKWGGASTVARAVRLQSLESLGHAVDAINETWRWIQDGAPKEAWGILADLQHHNQDPYAALEALRAGLRADPQNQQWWLEAAELYYEVGHIDAAARAAVKGVSHPDLRPRCLEILFSAAELSLSRGEAQDAKYIADICTRLGVDELAVSMLHVRVSIGLTDYPTASRWLQHAEKQDRGNAEAASLRESLPEEFRARSGLMGALMGTREQPDADQVKRRPRKWSTW